MSAVTNSTKLNKTTQAAARPLWLVGLLTLAAALLANLALLPVLLAALNLPRDFMPFRPLTIATVTTVGVAGAVAAFALVRRFAARPARTYWIVVVVALVVSILPNLSVVLGADPAMFPFPGFTPLNAVVLSVFHVVTALVCGTLLTRLAAPRRA